MPNFEHLEGTPQGAETLPFNSETIAHLKQDASFQYAPPVIKTPTAIEQLWDTIMGVLQDWLLTIFNVAFDSDYAVWGWGAAGLSIILFIGFRLKWFELRMSRRKKGRKRKISLPEQLRVSEHDLAMLLKKAIAQGDYREATRLTYIQGLKLLAAKNTIDFGQWELHTQIARQISAAHIRKSFNDLGYFFQYVCYGNYEVSEVDFAAMQATYHELEQQIRK
ncbi:hypothetical protein [Persicobacter psychrovividus]|uniref:DUF4129 domain-containing protein n=1 Tax=Persicobacter psychrovividus TaxID=387638 RepID=A0ABM7VG61_9BACT|nr:hypothetical protein PEPS_21820 [Persicobacter psychrovividus]